MTASHLNCFRALALFCVACGMVSLAYCDEQPDSHAGDASPWANHVAINSKQGTGSGLKGSIERLLEDVPATRLIMWNSRPIEEIVRAQTSNPNKARTKASTGEVYQSELNRLQQLSEYRSAKVDDYFLRGLIHFDQGQWKLAFEDFDTSIRMSDNPAAELFQMRGLAQYRLNHLEAARKDLDQSVRLSANVRNLNNRGVVAAAQGEFELALKDFDAALSIRQFVINRTAVSINQALVLSELGEQDQALEILVRLVEQPISDFRAERSATVAYVYGRKGDFRKSATWYSTVISMAEAERASAPTDLGIPGDHCLTAARENERTVRDAMFGRAVAFHQIGQIAAAISDYTYAIRICPNFSCAYVNRAAAWCETGNFEFAGRDLEMAIKLNAEDAFAWGNRGLLRLHQGSTQLSQSDFARCLKLRKDLQPRIERLSAGLKP